MALTNLRLLLLVLVIVAVCAHSQAQQHRRGNQQHNNKNGRPQRQKPQQGGGGGNQNNNNNNNKRPNQKRPGGQQAHKQQQNQQADNQQQQQQQQQQNNLKYVTKQVPKVGRVRGRIIKSLWSGKNVMQFIDIPYGKAQRFKPSQPADPWKEILDTYKPHAGCPSIQELSSFAAQVEDNIDVEDCLRLTINSKSLTGEVPVMVYIHGDFLYDGNSMEATPGYLLEEDVILVSVRYRLGPFGFLSTMSDDIPGNAAVTDVILALQWIQNHISEFGGDPSRVTLFGQVGGAAMINLLTMSPAVPDGLFHRVIYQSGSVLSPTFITDNPLPATKDIARYAGCKNVNKVEAINKCMRRLNATALLEAFNAHGDAKASSGVGAYGGMQFVIGGPSGILPEHPGKLLAADKFKPYPTLGGSVKNPGTFILKDIYLDNFNETIIDDVLDGMGYINHIIQQTNGADPTGAWKQFAQDEIFTAEDIKNGSFYRLVPGLIDLCSTIPFKNPVMLTMQANAKKLPQSTYLYSFDYAGELNRYTSREDDMGDMPFELGISLTDENLYLFPWPRYNLLNSNKDIKIAKRMVALWTSFAANGVPKAPGAPAWPSMTEDTGPYMKIERTMNVAENYLDEYNIAVKEAKLGCNLANDDFFESLVDINAEEKQDDNTTNDANDEDDEDKNGKGRGTNYVIIAKRTKRIKQQQQRY